MILVVLQFCPGFFVTGAVLAHLFGGCGIFFAGFLHLIVMIGLFHVAVNSTEPD
jgi:hypothetical protein